MQVGKRTSWAWTLATFFGIGRLRPGPGTWASVATVGLWYAASLWFPGKGAWPVCLALATCVTVLGIPVSTIVARESGSKDPSIVVIDEVAGQLITFIGVTLSWKSLVL